MIIMAQHTLTEKSTQKPTFWNDAVRYSSVANDVPFVEEVAYCMVTLHRTGA